MSVTQTIEVSTGVYETLDRTIESDFIQHPSDLVDGGTVNTTEWTVQDLRNAIPAYCFRPSITKSFFYLFRDCLVTAVLVYLAYNYIPLIENQFAHYAAWAVYGYVQGLQMTGLWTIAHDAGHGNFSSNEFLNHGIGFLLHSALMTPYFSWQSTHRRHHIYANHLVKDHNYVPPDESRYASLLGISIDKLEEVTEDSPIVTLIRLVVQQMLGLNWYYVNNITAGQGSLAAGKTHNPPSAWLLGNSHFHPWSTLFRSEEAPWILLSDLGLAATGLGIWLVAQRIGWPLVALLYIQPYFWVNHWVVAITYLHHTHPDLPKFEPEAWTFLRGATATVDRNLGFAGRHFFHNIADYHVIHHVFSRVPHYHLEEATKAIIPLLGDDYHQDKHRNFWACLWESFVKCQYVVPDDPDARPQDRTMVYRAGPAPLIESRMGRGGLGMERYLDRGVQTGADAKRDKGSASREREVRKGPVVA